MPSRQAAPPASARATKSLLCPIASGTVAPLGQVGGDSGREGAAGAVVVARVHPLPGQDSGPVGASHHVVRRIGEMPALHHHVAGARGPDALGDGDPCLQSPEGLDVGLAEHGGLAQVRRDHQRMGEEMPR